MRYCLPALCTLVLALPASAQDDPPPQDDTVQSTLNAFNPTITVFSNALWRLDNKHVREVRDGEVIDKDDKFLFRETEVDFRAAVDPYVDAVMIASFEQEVPGEFEAEVEEGYGVIKSLPVSFWEDPPLGTTIKVGRFLGAVGRQNRLHTHDMPQSQRGLAFEHFIGEHPYIVNGASATGFLPWFSDESTLTYTLEAVQGGGWEFAEDGTNRPAYTANLSYFTTFADEHDLEITPIAWYGNNDDRGKRQASLYSLDVLYKWSPLQEGAWHSIVLAGQAYYGSRELDDSFDDMGMLLEAAHTERAFGWFAYGQYQFDRRWYAGIRYDQVQAWTDVDGTHHREDMRQRVNPYVSWYVSEFFRLRAGYEHTFSDFKEDDDLKTFLLEINLVFGAHPPHPYWVNQ